MAKFHKTGGYSREFTPRGKGRRYTLDAIPAGFWTAVRAKAKAEKVSMRTLILRLLKGWLEADDQWRKFAADSLKEMGK